MSPINVDVVDVPRIRQLVRWYPEALSNSWRYPAEHPCLTTTSHLPGMRFAAAECKTEPIGDRPYTVSSNLGERRS